MLTDFISFISYAHERHCRDGHRCGFDCCQRRTCRRARQLEVYLMLTGQWMEAAYGWAGCRGRG